LSKLYLPPCPQHAVNGSVTSAVSNAIDQDSVLLLNLIIFLRAYVG
jgi:hypothetical protein